MQTSTLSSDRRRRQQFFNIIGTTQPPLPENLLLQIHNCKKTKENSDKERSTNSTLQCVK